MPKRSLIVVHCNLLNCLFTHLGLLVASKESSGKVVMAILFFCGSVKAGRARVSTLYHAVPARVFTGSNVADAGKLLALALVVVLCIVVWLSEGLQGSGMLQFGWSLLNLALPEAAVFHSVVYCFLGRICDTWFCGIFFLHSLFLFLWQRWPFVACCFVQ